MQAHGIIVWLLWISQYFSYRISNVVEFWEKKMYFPFIMGVLEVSQIKCARNPQMRVRDYLHSSSPGDRPNLRIEPRSPMLQVNESSEPPGKPILEAPQIKCARNLQMMDRDYLHISEILLILPVANRENTTFRKESALRAEKSPVWVPGSPGYFNLFSSSPIKHRYLISLSLIFCFHLFKATLKYWVLSVSR